MFYSHKEIRTTTNIKLLEELSNNKHEHVKISIIKNPNCPEYILEKFINDKSIKVFKSLLEKSEPEFLEKIYRTKNLNSVDKFTIVSNQKCSEDILLDLFKNNKTDDNLKKGILNNNNCPLSVLLECSIEEKEDVFDIYNVLKIKFIIVVSKKINNDIISNILNSIINMNAFNFKINKSILYEIFYAITNYNECSYKNLKDIYKICNNLDYIFDLKDKIIAHSKWRMTEFN